MSFTKKAIMAEPGNQVTPEQAEQNRIDDFNRAEERRKEMIRRREEKTQISTEPSNTWFIEPPVPREVYEEAQRRFDEYVDLHQFRTGQK
jgi:hypothetical protein